MLKRSPESKRLPVTGLTEEEWRVEFYYRFRVVMEVLELRNVDISRGIDITEQRISNWVNGITMPSTFQMHRFCTRFGVSLDYIVSGDKSSLKSHIALCIDKVEAGVNPRR